jgi:predicted MPP superfamily phosphohydrolase
MSPSRGKHNARMRRAMLSTLDAVLLNGLIARWSYRCGLHGELAVSEHELQLPAGRPLPRPLVLAFASDFHAGPATHPAMFSRLIDELMRQRPDVLLLGGDYVSCKAEQVEVLAEQLSRCNPPLGKYGVLGNHDLLTDDAHIVRRLQAAGVQVLVNRNCPLPPPFECVSICGVDDPWTGSGDIAETFRGAGSVRVLLSHSPDGLLLPGQQAFDLALAGHTHGGQVALADGTAIVDAGGPLSRVYGRGRFEIAGNGPLIVSRGVGCSNLPIRINSDPELIICRLVGS